jgi:hypothetical protein
MIGDISMKNVILGSVLAVAAVTRFRPMQPTDSAPVAVAGRRCSSHFRTAPISSRLAFTEMLGKCFPGGNDRFTDRVTRWAQHRSRARSISAVRAPVVRWAECWIECVAALLYAVNMRSLLQGKLRRVPEPSVLCVKAGAPQGAPLFLWLTIMFEFALSGLRSGLRGRSFHAVFILGVLMIGIAYLSGFFSPRQPQTVALDVGFSGIRFSLVLLNLFWVQELVAREIDRRVILFSLAYPVSRGAFPGRALCGRAAPFDCWRQRFLDCFCCWP